MPITENYLCKCSRIHATSLFIKLKNVKDWTTCGFQLQDLLQIQDCYICNSTNSEAYNTKSEEETV